MVVGLVVILHTFYSNHSSLNLAEVILQCFFVDKMLFGETTEMNDKEAGFGQCFAKEKRQKIVA